MNSGFLSGRHYATGEPIELRWENGVIQSIEPAPNANADLWLAPGLVDLQINGYGGIDFQQDHLSVEQLLTAVTHLHKAGCTRFLLTLITDDWARLSARLRHIRKLRESNDTLRHAIAGWHIEGPFLSAEPGFCGAHDASAMRDPSPAHLDELRELTGTDPLLITVAPERKGALDCVAHARKLGIQVSLGHTNASAELLAEAVRRGASAFTHLGNGCTRELDRHDNILWRVFETPGLISSLIPDGIHVSPALFRLAHRVLGDSIYYTTDAMSAAGMPPGRYPLGKLELEVGPDQIVRYPGRTNFAGSALRPVEGVFRAARMLNCRWQGTWARFSETPTRLMKLPVGFAIGAPANFCVVRTRGDHELEELRTFSAGTENT
jgi:N-acetylglucosamine-6-phosphate deacetylase